MRKTKDTAVGADLVLKYKVANENELLHDWELPHHLVLDVLLHLPVEAEAILHEGLYLPHVESAVTFNNEIIEDWEVVPAFDLARVFLLVRLVIALKIEGVHLLS